MRKPRDNGAFLRMRKGIFEHVKQGWMDEQMFLAYSVLLETCDWATGVWHGSGARLRDLTGSQWSERVAQRVLERLEEGRYIQSLHQTGKRGNHNVLINNYIPTSGPDKDKKLRPVSAGNPLSNDKTDDICVAGVAESNDKTNVMAVAAGAEAATKATTKPTTKATSQASRIQEYTKTPPPTEAVQEPSKRSFSLSAESVEPEGFDISEI